jgi:hypothetical protein
MEVLRRSSTAQESEHTAKLRDAEQSLTDTRRDLVGRCSFTTG